MTAEQLDMFDLLDEAPPAHTFTAYYYAEKEDT